MSLTKAQIDEITSLIQNALSHSEPLTDDQRKSVEDIVAQKFAVLPLSPAHKYDLFATLGRLAVGVIAVLGVAGYFAVTSVAKDAAAKIAPSEVATSLIPMKEFQELLLGAAGFAEPGAVMAFDRPNGCPKGWADYTPGHGRVIIGVGAGKDLTARGLNELGGYEAHAMTIDEMPAHDHQVYPHAGFIVGSSSPTQGAGSDDPLVQSHVQAGLTSGKGGGQAMSFMPPFVALYLCKKE